MLLKLRRVRVLHVPEFCAPLKLMYKAKSKSRALRLTDEPAGFCCAFRGALLERLEGECDGPGLTRSLT